MLLAFILVSGVGGVLTAGLLLPAVGTVGAVSNASVDLFDELPADLDIGEQSEQSVILDADGNVLATFYAENRIVVPTEEISEHLFNAVVAIEDHRFYEHNGVDLEGIMRATFRNLTTDDLEGASTLTQQYVKNVLIEEGRVTGDQELIDAAIDQSYGRKLHEARLAIALEQEYSKEEILTGYLNIAQFGPSQYGVEVASQHYFNKSAADVTIAEAALLAGITQSPARWDPVANPENSEGRRNSVLNRMLTEGYITQEEHDEAVETSVEDMLDPRNNPRGCGVAGTSAYFCDYVVRSILNDPAFGEDIAERRQLLNRGGLTIHTTIDPDTQDAAFDAITDQVPVDEASGFSMALSAIEPGTGHILAMAQATNYGPATEDDPNATQVNYNVGEAYGGGQGFQSGSVYKVFVLIEWLRQGHSLMERVDGDNRDFPREVWNISCDPSRAADYDPMNLEGYGGGQWTVLDATRLSINIPFVEMATQLDLCAVRDVAASMGLETGTESGEYSELLPNPASVLGSNTVTPLSMANAFATLANDGVACDPIAITAIQDRNGNDIEVPGSNCQRVLESDIVDAVTYALQTPLQSNGTAPTAAIPGRDAAGKTGTANNDYHAWFAGYIPQMAAAVWMGHPDGDISMAQTTVAGQWRPRVYGGLIPAPTWGNFMREVTADMPIQNFGDADDDYIYGEEISVPSVGGRSVDEAREILEDAGFEVRVGDPVDSGWPEGQAAATWPSAGSQQSRGSTVTIHPSGGRSSSSNDSDGDSGGGSNDDDDD